MVNLAFKFTQNLDENEKSKVLTNLKNYIEYSKKKCKTYPHDLREMFEHIITNYSSHLEQECLDICSSNNPRFTLRKKIVHCAYTMAHLAIFFTEESDLSIPYTTKEMKKYMPLLFKNEPNLLHFTKILNIPSDELTLYQIEYIFQYSFLRTTFILNAYNNLRVSFNDNNEDFKEDWYIAMIFSMYVAVEHQYRKQLNLPSVITEDNPDNIQTFFLLWFKIFEMLDIDNPKEFWVEQWNKHLNKTPPF